MKLFKSNTLTVNSFFGLLLGQILMSVLGSAQTLEISLPTMITTKTVPLVWGRIETDQIRIGSETFALVKEPSNLKSLKGGKEPVKVDSESSNSSLLSLCYDYKATEKDSCSQSVRFDDFKYLIGNVSSRIESLRLVGSESWRPCFLILRNMFNNLNTPLLFSSDESSERASIIVRFRGSQDLAGSEENPKHTANAPIVSSNFAPISLQVDSRDLDIFPGGWFVLRTDDYSPLKLILKGGGNQEFSKVIFPWLVQVGASNLAGVDKVQRINLLQGKAHLSIKVIESMPSQSSRQFDFSPGLGYGYGKGIPGEVKGDRNAILMRYRERDAAGILSLFTEFSGTYARSSAVPWTAQIKAALAMTGANESDHLAWHFGLGGQLFQSKVKASSRFEGNLKNIPEQVISPIVVSGIETKLGSSFVTSIQLDVTPLYIPGSGFYPSYNPSLDIGYLTSRKGVLLLGWALSSIRYPTRDGSVRLGIETVSLGWKRCFD